MPRTLSDTARAKMLDAATEVVTDVGVGAFSVDEVARRSGVAKTTIYRHFPNAKELLVAALDQALVPPPVPDEGSLEADVRAYLHSVRGLFVDPQLRTLHFEIYAATTRDPELRDLHQSLMAGRSGPTRAIFDHALARDELRSGIDYPTLLEIIQGPLVFRAMSRPDRLDHAGIDELVERMLVLLAR